jgi:hypothetical protein
VCCRKLCCRAASVREMHAVDFRPLPPGDIRTNEERANRSNCFNLKNMEFAYKIDENKHRIRFDLCEAI